MNKFRIAFATLGILLSIGITYQVIKLASWAQLVAAPYMEATNESRRCDRFEAAQHDNDLVRENKLKHMVSPECPFDEQACDKTKKLWEDYEISRKAYHERFPL